MRLGIKAVFQKLSMFVALFGWRGMVLGLSSKVAKKPVLVSVFVPRIGQTLKFRLKTSDVDIASQIFINEEYALSLRKPVRTILDAGANTGFSAVYFAKRFPDATIVAVEPEASNFELLKHNTAPFPHIHCVRAALWDRDVELEVVDWFGKCGFRTQESAARVSNKVCDTIPGLTVPSIMREHGIEQVDLLKIDIEGAEKMVLKGAPEWLDKVSVLAVELHDWLDPDCSRIFSEATRRFDTHWEQGENRFCARKGWV
jgi:FkbM family methyltransferase